MYIATIFLGINNCSTILPIVARERLVFYREIFSGMYSSYIYSFAQVNTHHFSKNSKLHLSQEMIMWVFYATFILINFHIFSAPDYCRSPLYFILSSNIHIYYISYNWLLFVCRQDLLVLLYNVLYASVLQLLGDVDNVIEPKYSSCCCTGICCLFNSQFICWIHYPKTGKLHMLPIIN